MVEFGGSRGKRDFFGNLGSRRNLEGRRLGVIGFIEGFGESRVCLSSEDRKDRVNARGKARLNPGCKFVGFSISPLQH